MPRCPMRISHSLLQMNDFCHRRLPGGQARGGDGRRARGERSTKTVGAFFKSAPSARERGSPSAWTRGTPGQGGWGRRARRAAGRMADGQRDTGRRKVSEGGRGAPDCPAAKPSVLRTRRASHKGQDGVHRPAAASAASAVSPERRNRKVGAHFQSAHPRRARIAKRVRPRRARPRGRMTQGARGGRRRARGVVQGGAGAQPRLRNFNNARGPRAARAQGRRKRYSPPP